MLLSRISSNCFVRNQVRFVRLKALSSAVNSFLGQTSRENEGMIEQDINELKKRGFSEVNVDSTLDEWVMNYLSVTNSGFQKSKKNLNKLQRQGKLDTKSVVEYLLSESENELRRVQSMSVETLEKQYVQRKGLEFDLGRQNESELGTTVLKEMIYEGTMKEFRPLANTESLFRFLERVLADKESDRESIISLEQMVQAFELAKLIPDKKSRLRGQFLAGQLIYSLNRVRLDPGNESFYIDSLLFHDKFKTATSLFESYKDRVRERWWYEVGMMTYLRSNKTLKFSYLYGKTKEIFSDDYIRPNVVKFGIQVLLRNRDIRQANNLVKDFISIQKNLGWANEDSKNNGRTLNFESSEEANQFLNEVQSPTKKDFISIISYYFLHGYSYEAWKLLDYFNSRTGLDCETFHFLCKRLRLQWLRSFELFVDEFKPHFSVEAGVTMDQLKEWFDSFLDDPSHKRVQTDFPYLLFDDLYQLLQSRRLNSVLDNFTTEFWSTDMKKTDVAVKSKKYQGLLKILLYGGREQAAFELLLKLENDRKEFFENGSCSSVFAPVNAYHYATIINYYAINDTNNNSKKIEDLLVRARRNNVPFNAALVDVSLKYLMKTKKYSDCSLLLETILSGEYPRMDIFSDSSEKSLRSPALYKTIWKFYGDCFRITNRFTDFNSTFYGIGNQLPGNVSKQEKIRLTYNMIDTFKRMVADDKVPISESIQKPLVRAFIANGEWCNLLTVLAYMKKDKIELSEDVYCYAIKGLKRSFDINGWSDPNRFVEKLPSAKKVSDNDTDLEHSRSECSEDISKEDKLMVLIVDYLIMKNYTLNMIEEQLKVLELDLDSIKNVLPKDIVIL